MELENEYGHELTTGSPVMGNVSQYWCLTVCFIYKGHI